MRKNNMNKTEMEKKMMKKKNTISVVMMAVCLLAAKGAWADGFTNWAVPTLIVTTGDGGMVVEGAFGNREGCYVADKVIIRGDTNNLKLVEAMVLSAHLTHREMRFYVIGCDSSYDNESMAWVYTSRHVMIR